MPTDSQSTNTNLFVTEARPTVVARLLQELFEATPLRVGSASRHARVHHAQCATDRAKSSTSDSHQRVQQQVTRGPPSGCERGRCGDELASHLGRDEERLAGDGIVVSHLTRGAHPWAAMSAHTYTDVCIHSLKHTANKVLRHDGDTPRPCLRPLWPTGWYRSNHSVTTMTTVKK